MIKEDYVSFETANLLKEKGFQEMTCGLYDCGNGRLSFMPEIEWNSKKDCPFISAPTLQMAMKWLREVHNIHINVFRYPAEFSGDDNEKRKPWWFQYTLLKPIKEIDIDSHMTSDEFESAEEAMDGAIKYCLENLV